MSVSPSPFKNESVYSADKIMGSENLDIVFHF